MPRIEFEKISVIEVLRHISSGLGGKFSEDISQAQMLLDNENGKGKMMVFEIAGISCLVYDITFYKEIEYVIDEKEPRHLYFIYVIAGYFHHKLGSMDSFIKMDAHQNIISEVDPRCPNYIKIPKNVPLKYIIINASNDPDDDRIGAYLSDLNKKLTETFSREGEGTFYQYMGNHSFKAMKSVEALFEINRDGALGRMQMESTICSILAAQIEECEDNFDSVPAPQLSADDLKKVQSVTRYIEENLSKKYNIRSLTKQSGLSQKKLQYAFKAVYQTTTIKFINDLKLEKSREWLIDGAMNISEITYALGFSNSSYYTFLFKRKFGMSPLEYRKKGG